MPTKSIVHSLRAATRRLARPRDPDDDRTERGRRGWLSYLGGFGDDIFDDD
jgi:hypothetical protein